MMIPSVLLGNFHTVVGKRRHRMNMSPLKALQKLSSRYRLFNTIKNLPKNSLLQLHHDFSLHSLFLSQLLSYL